MWSNSPVHIKTIYRDHAYMRGGLPHRGELPAQLGRGNPPRWCEVLSVSSRVNAQGRLNRLAGVR